MGPETGKPHTTYCEILVKRCFRIGSLPSTDGQDKASVEGVGEAESLNLEEMGLNSDFSTG